MLQKKIVIKGALLLTAAGMIGRIIGFFYRIFLSRAIGAEGVGIYQLIFPLYALSFSLTTAGIQTSISRFVSAKTASGDKGGARRIFYLGTLLSFGLSLAVSLLLLRFHDLLAAEFVRERRSADSLRLLAYVVPLGSIHACINGYYYGMKKAGIPAIVEVLEHAVRLGALILLCSILQERGIAVTPAVAVCAMILEETFAALFSLTALGIHFSANPVQQRPLHKTADYAKELFRTSTPLTLNRVLVNVLQSIEALLIPLQLQLFGLNASVSLSVYGVLTGMAMPLILFPTALTSSVCTMLLPVISEAQATNRLADISVAVKKICLSCLALGTACFLSFFFFGELAGQLIFHSDLAGSFIRALAWICPILYLNPALFAILNGMGKTTHTFLHNMAGVLVRIAFILFAVPRFGISGFFAGTLVSQLLVFVLSLRAIRAGLR